MKEEEGRMKKKFLSLLLIVISIIILLMAKYNNWIAEYIFARGIFRFLSQIIISITNLIPVSIMEFTIYLGIPFLIGLVVYLIKILLVKDGIRKERILNILANISLITSLSLSLFILFAGINYYRYTFSQINDIKVEESSLDELYELNMHLTRQAYELREQLELDGQYINQDGVFQFANTNWDKLTETLNSAFTNLSIDYPVLRGNYSKPKPVLSSKFMSRMEITGIFWPFTLEANINTHAPDYTIPSTMAHEMAHLRGFMREDEANYIAFLACLYSDDLSFRYSGTMLALTHAGNVLYREDPLLYFETREYFDKGMRADLRHKSNYWSQFDDTLISTVSTNMNDAYLKINNQKDGVKSYGRMVDLLLAGYKDDYYYHEYR